MVNELISAHEKRRRAPFHFFAKARNARFAAYALHAIDSTNQCRFADEIGYGGSPSIALAESFHREAAIALELIVKAVIAQLIENKTASPHVTKVCPTHNLKSLWSDADLPPLSKSNEQILLLARRILFWSGRYAAPRKEDKKVKEEELELDRVANKQAFGTTYVMSFAPFDWATFDGIYEIAAEKFWTLANKTLP